MTALLEKEQQLQDRKEQLESYIQQIKGSLSEEDVKQISKEIQVKAQELTSLEAQLELTEIALRKARDKRIAREEYEASREYKDKQRAQEKLTAEARKQTMSIYDSLSKLLDDVQDVKAKVSQADSILMELAEDKASAQRHVQSRQLPFSLLWSLESEMRAKLADMKRRQDKGLV